METKIKQRLGNITKKKRGGERYEKVQRRGGSSEEEERGDNDSDSDSDSGCDSDSDSVSGYGRVSAWLRAVKYKVQQDIARSVTEAKSFPVDMHYVFALKFLESYSYFALSQILVLYLHEDFGVGDVEAGVVYGMWGAAITCGGLLVSWINDNLGVKKSLSIGFSLSLLSSVIVAVTTSKTVLYLTLFVLYPFGTAMGIPMLTVAVKRYTTAKNRGFAFGLYYSVMNMAALVSGPMVDALYIGLRGQLSNGWSGYRVVILTCGLSNLVSLFVAVRFLREINIEEEGDDFTAATTLSSSDHDHHHHQQQHLSTFTSPLHDRDEEASGGGAGGSSTGAGSSSSSSSSSSSAATLMPAAASTSTETASGETSGARVVSTYAPTKQHPWTTAKVLCQSKTFWRFSVLTLFLVNLHAIFRHLDATLPTYLVRCFGDSVPKGSLYSINPFMIIFLTPLVAACTNTSNHFDMIKYGGFVTAASPFFLAADTSIIAVVLMLVVLSLGEAIWSPRLYDYVMTIAPEGREASFSALASAPLFAAKIPVGLMSGYLLHKYLPEEEEGGGGEVHQQPQTMWLIIGLMTITSPVLIAIFDSCIREPEKRNKGKVSRGKQVEERVGENAFNNENDGESDSDSDSNNHNNGERSGALELELGVMNYTEEEDED